MSRFSPFLPVSVVAIAVLSSPVIVQAQSVNPTKTASVSPGYGVTIIPNFPVYKIWIDDGSRLGVDFDRPPEEGATIIHVYQSAKSANTFSADGNTMMTLVSRDGQLQKIAINFTTGAIPNNILDLSSGHGNSSEAQFAALSPNVSQSRVDVIRAGLRKAIAEGSIPQGGNFNQAIDRFLSLMEQGKSLEDASRQTGVMLEVIGKLAKMGIEEKGYRLDIPPEDQTQANSQTPQRVTYTLKDFGEPQTVKESKMKVVPPDEIQADQEVSAEELLASSEHSSPLPETPKIQKKTLAPEKLANEEDVEEIHTDSDEETEPRSSSADSKLTSEETSEETEEDKSLVSLAGGMESAKQIEKGFESLVKAGDVDKYSQTGLNIQKLISRVKWGESPHFAAQKTNVDDSVLSKLWESGQGSEYHDSHGMANAIVRGLAIANRTGEVGYSSRLSWNVQFVVDRLRRGYPLEDALYRSGVTENNANRLLQLGNYSPK